LRGACVARGAAARAWRVALAAAVGGRPGALRPRLAVEEGAWAWAFVFYASFGVVVTSSVALAGVLLVFAFLIIPAAIGALHADTFRRQLAVAWVAGTATALVGLAISYAGDFSTGATLVCTYGAALAIAGIGHGLRLPRPSGALLEVGGRLGRWIAAAVLAASAIWIVISPRADQPLLDLVEQVFPGVRSAYMDDKAREIAADADRY